MPPRTPSEPLLVRVDPDTRHALQEIATSSHRSLSQLVRAATIWWVTAADRRHLHPEDRGTHKDKFVNVRFSASDMSLVRAVADQMGLDRGAVIRHAVRAWLATGTPTDLDAASDTSHPAQVAV